MRVIPERSGSRCRDARRQYLCESPPTGWAEARRLNLRSAVTSVRQYTKRNAWTFRITETHCSIGLGDEKPSGPHRCQRIMRVLRVAIACALLGLRLPATLIPQPNLAKRIELADVIVVAKVISGTTLASGSRVSSDIVLHVARVLKGELLPGGDIAAHLEGGGYFGVPNARQSAITPKLYGIWFLNSVARPYALLS